MRITRIVSTALAVVGVTATVSVLPTAASTGPAATLNGAGSTFDQPLFTRAFYVYNQKHPNVIVNYAAIGSGGGEQQFEANTVNFGASDVPMLAADLAHVPASAGPVLQVPVALGGVAIAYNVPGVPTGIRLSPSVISGIYLGSIKNWNDPAIKGINPKVSFPNLAITTVHRADGSGTTYIFSNYMADISSTWSSQVGVAKTLSWPNGVGGQGNTGVAGLVQTTPGSIGYVELAYVLQAHMSDAAVENPKGDFILPTKKSVAADAALHPRVSPTNFSITNLGGSPTSYPISGYSWGLIYQNQTNAAIGTAMTDLFYWLTQAKGGQLAAAALDYVPLPKNVEQLAQSTLAKVTGPGGTHLLPKSASALAALLK